MDLNTENNAENSADSYCTSSSQIPIPSVLFICKICRQAFGSLKLYMSHKRTDHSEELKGIKVIIFEERFFKTDDDFYRDEKIFPPPSDLNFLNYDYLENDHSSINTENKLSETNFNIKTEVEPVEGTDTTTNTVDSNNTVGNCFDNGRDAILEDACQQNADEISPSKRCKIVKTEKQSTENENTSSYTTTEKDRIQTEAFKAETDQYQSRQDDQVQELEDNKFIVARSIIKSSDDSDKVQQLASTSTPIPLSIPSRDTPNKISFHVTSEKQKEGGPLTAHQMSSTPRYNTRRSSKINYSQIQRCEHCSKTVVTVDDLLGDDHKLSIQPVTCTVCQTKLKTVPGKRNTGTAITSDPIVDLLNAQNDRKCSNGSVNVVLLDPDPTSRSHAKPIKISSESPVTCKLCRTKLETEPDVKNHAANCWLHNKDRHIFCVTCEKSFQYPMQLKEHHKMKHSGTQCEIGSQDTAKAVTTKHADVNNLGLDLYHLPLGEWIQKRKKLFPDIILVDPDPTSDSYSYSVQATEQHTARWSPSSVPLMCKLCRFKCQSENLMKCHVQICWTYNKKKHVYCVPCGKHSSNGSCEGDVNSSETSLETDQNIFCRNTQGERKGDFCCRDCRQKFKTLQDLEEHESSAHEFFRTMKQIQSNKNAFLHYCALCKRTFRSSDNLEKHRLASHMNENEGDEQAKGAKRTTDSDIDVNFKCTEKSCTRNYKHFHTTQLKSLQSLNLFEIEIEKGNFTPEVDEAPIDSVPASIAGSGSGSQSSTNTDILTLTAEDDIKVVDTVGHRKRDAGETSTTDPSSVISELGSPSKRLKFSTGGGYSELRTRVTRAMLAQAKSSD